MQSRYWTRIITPPHHNWHWWKQRNWIVIKWFFYFEQYVLHIFFGIPHGLFIFMISMCYKMLSIDNIYVKFSYILWILLRIIKKWSFTCISTSLIFLRLLRKLNHVVPKKTLFSKKFGGLSKNFQDAWKKIR